MKPFLEQAQFYAGYHRNPMTRYTHFVGIPMIVFSLMIFFGYIKLIVPGVFATNFAVLGTVAIMAYYFKLQWQLSLALTPFMLFLLWIASFLNADGPTTLSLWIFLITFVSGWVIQFYGHYLEQNKPALMDSFCQAMVAPLFLVAELFFIAGMMQDLKKELHPEVEAPKAE